MSCSPERERKKEFLIILNLGECILISTYC